MNTRRILKVVVVAGLLGVTSTNYAVEETWTRMADMPTRRLGLSTSVVNGKIYAIGGGYSIEGPHSRIVEEYDPVTDIWTKKADMPTGRIGHAASVVNEKIYVIGGDVRAEVSGSEVEEYDPATDTWTRKADMPTKRTFLCACAMDGKIYAIGGITAPAMHTLSTMEVYDPATDTWTTKADMPTPRCILSTCAVNGQIYAAGGSRNSTLRTVEEYDPATDTWTRKADMTTTRASLCTSVVNGKIYAIGGASGMTGPVLKTVEEYDPTTDTWTIKANMPTPRWFFSTSAVNGKIYAIAGSVGFPPHSSVSTVEEYDTGLSSPSPDFNGDGIVDSADMCMMIDYWGTDEQAYDIAPTPFGDGIVDVQDLILLSEHLFEEILPYGLVGYWRLDESEGNTAYDSAGKKDSLISGDPIWRPDEGKRRGALEFDGINDHVIADFLLNPADGEFSAFAWIKGGAPGQVIISQTDGTGIGRTWLGADTLEGKLMSGLVPIGARSPTPPLVSEFVITDGEWHHIGIVVVEYQFMRFRYLYLDGVRIFTDTQSVVLPYANGGMYIGVDKNLDPTSFFSGLIDDVRIYDKALTPEQIEALAQ